MTQRRRFLTALAAAVALLSARRASAQLTFAFDPSLSVGYTDNVNASPTNPIGSGFLTLSSIARLEYHALTSDYSLGYRFAATRYYADAGIDTTSHDLTAASVFHLSPAWGLRLSADGAVGRTSSLTVVSSTMTAPQAALPGSSRFVSASAGEELTFEPHPRWRFVQALTGSTVKYRDLLPEPPRTTSIAGLLRGEHPLGIDTPSLELQVTDFILTGGDPGRIPPTPFHAIIVLGLAGWTREFDPVWTGTLQAGVTTLTPSTGATSYAPGGRAVVSYRRLTWFATLTVEQQAVTNMFTGQATVNDMAVAQVTLPLDSREQLVLAGTGSYTYARLPDAAGDLHHAFDQWMLSSLVSYRFVRAPLYVSLLYALVDQRAVGNSLDLFRQTVTLNLTGAFLWGEGTPPLFGGGGL